MTEDERWTMVQTTLGLSALVLDSPHSGRWMPPDFRPACTERALREAEDVDVHALWQGATTLGASLVHARFPRTYIDVNRAADEIDAELLSAPWPGPLRETPKVRLGKGLVWRMLDDGTPIYDRLLTPQEMNQRIERCWVPYHRALDQAIEVALRRHGHVIHLNCHSMPAVAQAYSTEHPFLHHADFVLGDRDGTTADPRLTRWMERCLNSRGYTVSINRPYKGVGIVRRNGRPAEGRHSVQVEINKRLYMSEETLQRHAGFEQVRQTLRELAEALLVTDLGLEGGPGSGAGQVAAHLVK
jgi:N-formylglutamate deformylase